MIVEKNPNALKDIAIAMQSLQGLVGKVGWFESAKYPDGTPVAMIAAQNEFGNPEKNIPPRPTVRPAITDKQSEWNRIAEQGAKAIIAGNSDATKVMIAITLSAEGAIAKNIATITQPPLAPKTIKARQRKGNSSTKPLVDTGLELATLTSVVTNANS